MSMSSSEFDQRLGAEPREAAAALEAAAARGEEIDPAQATAAKAALAFEKRLEGALRLPVDEDALVAIALGAPRRKRRPPRPPAWLAMAASIALLAGIAGLTWYASRPVTGDVTRYVENHYRHDGADVLAKTAQGATPEQVRGVLASLGVKASDELSGQVRFIKFCPTPDSQGAHMVLATPDGPATVLFMPAVTVDEPLLIRFDGVEAQVVGLETGAAAIIGASGETARELRASLEAGVHPLGADT
jgi:hypothetical protein